MKSACKNKNNTYHKESNVPLAKKVSLSKLQSSLWSFLKANTPSFLGLEGKEKVLPFQKVLTHKWKISSRNFFKKSSLPHCGRRSLCEDNLSLSSGCCFDAEGKVFLSAWYQVVEVIHIWGTTTTREQMTFRGSDQICLFRRVIKNHTKRRESPPKILNVCSSRANGGWEPINTRLLF